MRVDDFDFELPEDLIALRPARPRDSARLLVVRSDGTLEHRLISDLPALLRAGDVLVANDSKVFPARLFGIRSPRQPLALPAKIELLLHKRLGPDRYRAFARPAKRLHPGDSLRLGQALDAVIEACPGGGEVDVVFDLSGTALDEAIAAEGAMPLPPYIAGKRPADAADTQDYQTAFAAKRGSVAAPTAGLHFTPALLARLEAAGIGLQTLTLHVGPGTFLPISAADTSDHRMHPEQAVLAPDVAARLNEVHSGGGRLVAVGTTALRTLESAADQAGLLHALDRETDIFITPGYSFRAADILLTNFHLPRSTLFMLVSAFCGLETMRRAYAEAIRGRYRFYSYGDACLLIR